MLRTVLSVAALAALVVSHAYVAGADQAQPAAPTKAAGSRSAKTSRPALSGPVNINTASAADFEALPGIGAKVAARIVEYRQKNGPFKKVEELMNVRGIGEKNFLKLKPQLTIGTAKADHAVQQ